MAVPVAAPNSAAIEEAHDDFSFGRPCVCHHLHQSCSPRTCREAAKRKAGRTRPQNIPIEGSSKLSDRPLFMGATLERLRQAAVRGCLVCGFLYAGLNAPLDAKMSWIADEKEEDIVVVIRRSTDFVQVYSRATAGRGGKYAVFTFYASTDSSKLPVHCSNFICQIALFCFY
jgi:hypothetical protein